MAVPGHCQGDTIILGRPEPATAYPTGTKSRIRQNAVCRNFHRTAILLGGSLTPIARPSGARSSVRQITVLRNLDGGAGFIGLLKSAVAFPSIAARIQIAVARHTYNNALVIDIPIATAAFSDVVIAPGLGVVGQSDRRLLGERTLGRGHLNR